MFGAQRSILEARLCRVQQRQIIIVKFEAKKDYYQSKIFVCVCKCGALAANFADAVDRLLIVAGVGDNVPATFVPRTLNVQYVTFACMNPEIIFRDSFLGNLQICRLFCEEDRRKWLS